MVRRAVIDLSLTLSKPVLMLTDADYNENGLQSLLAEYGSAYEINLNVFKQLQNTITGWAAGKPGRPGEIFPKRIVLFSPHPDDDVISMGGTLTRLAGQGHEVHVAYQTSGNIAVFDEDALRFAEFVTDFCDTFEVKSDAIGDLTQKMVDFLNQKNAGEVDLPQMQQLKGLIRRGEARAGARICGVEDQNLHYLDLPFYETGVVRKKPIGEEDIQITVDLMRQVKPHQIYAAGDLSDPHGTHRTCLDVIFEACRRCRDDDWMKECDVWLYRGAWQEWAPHEIEMAVPLSPQEVERKRVAIFRHESQKDRALFPGPDAREFWQRAEARNAQTLQGLGTGQGRVDRRCEPSVRFSLRLVAKIPEHLGRGTTRGLSAIRDGRLRHVCVQPLAGSTVPPSQSRAEPIPATLHGTTKRHTPSSSHRRGNDDRLQRSHLSKSGESHAGRSNHQLRKSDEA